MSYRCQVCGAAQPKGTPMLRWTVHRSLPITRVTGGKQESSTRTEIEREVPVCQDCLDSLQSGRPLSTASATNKTASWLEPRKEEESNA